MPTKPAKATAQAAAKKAVTPTKTGVTVVNTKQHKIAKTGDKTLATGSPVRESINPELDAGAGQENMGAQDLAIPQLVILQSGSPQVKKADAAHIKGAEEGNICDPLGERLFDGESGVTLVPISYRRSHVEWKPKGEGQGGGGFVKDHGPDGKIMDLCTPGVKNRPTLKNGNTISVVAEYFVFLIDEDGSYKPYVLRMASTQLKKARRWNTMINQLRAPKQGGGTFNPAMFFSVFDLTTVPESNDQGSWFGWKITRVADTLQLDNGPEIYAAARDFRAQVAQGTVKAHQPTDDAVNGTGAAEDNEGPM